MIIHDVLTRMGWLWIAAAVIGLGLLWLSVPVGSLAIGMGFGGLLTVLFIREVI